MNPHHMTDASTVRQFALGGNATLTLRSKATGTRFTYKIRQPQDSGPHFVKVLTGPDHYTFLGTVFTGGFRLGRRSTITADAPSAKAFEWFWRAIRANVLPAQLEVWHEGRCCRCGRELTVPESIESGIGPECARITGRTWVGLKSPADPMELEICDEDHKINPDNKQQI